MTNQERVAEMAPWEARMEDPVKLRRELMVAGRQLGRSSLTITEATWSAISSRRKHLCKLLEQTSANSLQQHLAWTDEMKEIWLNDQRDKRDRIQSLQKPERQV